MAGEGRRHRLERIHLLKRQVAADRRRLGRGVPRLVVVEVTVRVGRHHHVVAGGRRRHAAVAAAPAHHGGAGRQAALQDLVPAQQAPAPVRQPAGHAADEPALQFILAGEPLCGNALLAVVTGAPRLLRALVAANVDERAREQLQDLVQHLLQEREGGVPPGAQHVALDAPGGGHLVAGAGAAQFRVAGQRRLCVAGHLDLRHHRHAAFGGVGHHPAHLRLGVVAGAGGAVGARAVVRQGSGGAPRTDLGEPRAGADLDPPALVVGQMPVQRVVLVQRHQVDQLLDERHREKVARHVEVQAAPGKPRMVDNVDGRQRGGRVRFAGAGVRRRRPSQKLAQRLRAPQHAARRGAGDRGAARGYRERVAFVVQVGTRSIGGQRDRARWGGGAERVCAARLSADGRQPGGQQAGRRAAVAVGQQRGVRGDRQRTGPSGHGHRTGDDRDPAHGVHSAPRCTARSYPVWVHASSPAADSATDAPHTPAAAPVAEYARCRAAVLARAGRETRYGGPPPPAGHRATWRR